MNIQMDREDLLSIYRDSMDLIYNSRFDYDFDKELAKKHISTLLNTYEALDGENTDYYHRVLEAL